MKILVVGGTGRAGSAIVEEALKRGHKVVITTRDANRVKIEKAAILEKEPLALNAKDIEGVDVVVDAVSVPWGSGKGYLHLDIATHIISLLRNTTTRAVFILGSASLAVPGTDYPAIEDYPKETAAAPWFDGALHQYYEWAFLQWVKNVDWIGFSPGEAFPEGPATGYRLSEGILQPDRNGQAHVTTGNMALAILDEIENRNYHHKHFGVFDK